jgi:hypothetical protein
MVGRPRKELVYMNRSIKALLGTMLAFSLLGLGVVAQPAVSDSAHRISADRWCC